MHDDCERASKSCTYSNPDLQSLNAVQDWSSMCRGSACVVSDSAQPKKLCDPETRKDADVYDRKLSHGCAREIRQEEAREDASVHDRKLARGLADENTIAVRRRAIERLRRTGKERALTASCGSGDLFSEQQEAGP